MHFDFAYLQQWLFCIVSHSSVFLCAQHTSLVWKDKEGSVTRCVYLTTLIWPQHTHFVDGREKESSVAHRAYLLLSVGMQHLQYGRSDLKATAAVCLYISFINMYVVNITVCVCIQPLYISHQMNVVLLCRLLYVLLRVHTTKEASHHTDLCIIYLK